MTSMKFEHPGNRHQNLTGAILAGDQGTIGIDFSDSADSFLNINTLEDIEPPEEKVSDKHSPANRRLL